ncbi:MAG: AMP-binding protein, partial [Nonomuraea sp.]|nr:AMP-binding protein [Nonomuraea sp.]
MTEGAAVGAVHELVELQSVRTPDGVAVSDAAGELSYRELERRANRLAHLLIERGAGRGRVVALCLPRSAELIVAVLAVLKSGAAYLPVDPAYPAERVEFMLADADPALVLRELPEADAYPESSPRVAVSMRDPAYVIYTSGSTGRPKGVVVEHGSAAELVTWAAGHFGPERLAHVLASTSMSFDVSVFETFAPLVCGGRVEVVGDLLALAERAEWHGTLISGVPSALEQLLTHGRTRISAAVVVTAGEALTAHHLATIRAAVPGCVVANLYGPTEATVYATAWQDAPGFTGAPPIGAPVPGVTARVLDAALAPAREGELY